MDSGSLLVYLADDIVTQNYRSIPGAHYDGSLEGYVFPPNASLPVIQLPVEDTFYTINARDFVTDYINDSGEIFGAVRIPLFIFLPRKVPYTLVPDSISRWVHT